MRLSFVSNKKIWSIYHLPKWRERKREKNETKRLEEFNSKFYVMEVEIHMYFRNAIKKSN